MPGVRVIPMNRDTLTFPRVDAGPTATWGGESVTMTAETAMSFGQIQLTLRKVTILKDMSRELIHDSTPAVDAIVMEELADALALEKDIRYLEGTGGNQPTGLYTHPDINNTDLSGAFTWDQVSLAAYQVEKNNSQITGWIGHPRVKQTLRTFKDSNGNYLYGNPVTSTGEMATLMGSTILYSSQVGITTRPGSAETWMVGGNWNDFIIGESTEGVRIESTNTGGDSFVKDEVWVKVVHRVDTALRHPLHFVRIVGIQA